MTTRKIFKNAVQSEKRISLLDLSERRRQGIKRKNESTDVSVYADAKEDCAHEREREASLSKGLRQADHPVLQRVCTKHLKNNVPLKPKQFDRLKRQKKNVRTLAKKNTSSSLKEKRCIIRQRGGFLSTLILPAIMAFGSILAGHVFGSGARN